MRTLKYDDLETAFQFVSGGERFGAAAYISRETGMIYLDSSELDPVHPIPEDVGDTEKYAEVPGRGELELGSTLVFRYMAEAIPGKHDEVAAIFRRKGAYGRFKQWLADQGRLGNWFEFEHAATKEALIEWAEGEGFTVE